MIWNARKLSLRYGSQKIRVGFETKVVYSVGIVEESVLDDLDRLLLCEIFSVYRIRKNLSDNSSQRAEQLREGKETS